MTDPGEGRHVQSFSRPTRRGSSVSLRIAENAITSIKQSVSQVPNGVQTCGRQDWRMRVGAGPQIRLSMRRIEHGL